MEKKQIKLVKGAMQGNFSDFEKLIEQKSSDILYFAIHMSNPQDGEDIAQESIINIYKGISKLKKPEAFNSWMFTVIKNTCISMMRKQHDNNSVPIDTQDDFTANTLVEDRREFLPIEFVEDEGKRAMVMEVIYTLPWNYRECLLLFYYQNMSYKEIADTMQTNEKKVTNDLSRARALLKKRLESRAQTTFNYSLLPMGSVSVFAQLYKSDASRVVTTEMIQRVMANVHSVIANLNVTGSSGSSSSGSGSSGSGSTGSSASSSAGSSASGSSATAATTTAATTTATTAAQIVAIAAIATVTVAGATIGILNFVNKNNSSDESTPPSTVQEQQKEIKTLADMIGEENEKKLLNFELGTNDEAAWQDYIKDIGVDVSGHAKASNNSYYWIYTLEEQGKQLVITVKKDASGDYSISHRFGDTQEIPKIAEVILQMG